MVAQPLSPLGLCVARRRRNLLVRKFAGLCRRYLHWYGNVSYDLRTNGEDFLLATVGSFRPRTIIDAGANVGDWSLAAAARCPEAEFHLFEISEPTFRTLVDRTGPRGNFHCSNVGLSDRPGTVTIRHYEELPALTTVTTYPHPFAFAEKTAQVVAGDAYAEEHNISHIDLLKIDVEGMEEQVLRGFGGMFARKAIDLIQFEYGRISIMNHFLLRDFYLFFQERGYVVGKIYPTYVDFRDYDMADEDFLGPNYLACRADREDYVTALRSGRSRSR